MSENNTQKKWEQNFAPNRDGFLAWESDHGHSEYKCIQDYLVWQDEQLLNRATKVVLVHNMRISELASADQPKFSLWPVLWDVNPPPTKDASAEKAALESRRNTAKKIKDFINQAPPAGAAKSPGNLSRTVDDIYEE